ncbi:TlpA family protein disulfide reductase [bacterium]|nr:TlpA family protein disulfide reductase [bacterium]
MKHLVFALVLSASAWGAVAPNFRGEILGGSTASVEKFLQPDKLLLVSFWATWCLPCMDELTHVRDYLKAHPDFPLTVLTVNVDTEQRSEVGATVRQMDIPFPVLMDGQMEILRKFHKEGSIPFSVVLDSKREILDRFSGYHDSMFGKIAEHAKKAGLGKKPEAPKEAKAPTPTKAKS